MKLVTSAGSDRPVEREKQSWGELIDIPGFGKLSIASKNDTTSKDATLLVVFGGIPVSKTEFDGIKRKKAVYVISGDYMWNFITNDLRDQFHIFASVSNEVGGNASYCICFRRR